MFRNISHWPAVCVPCLLSSSSLFCCFRCFPLVCVSVLLVVLSSSPLSLLIMMACLKLLLMMVFKKQLHGCRDSAFGVVVVVALVGGDVILSSLYLGDSGRFPHVQTIAALLRDCCDWWCRLAFVGREQGKRKSFQAKSEKLGNQWSTSNREQQRTKSETTRGTIVRSARKNPNRENAEQPRREAKNAGSRKRKLKGKTRECRKAGARKQSEKLQH